MNKLIFNNQKLGHGLNNKSSKKVDKKVDTYIL